MTLLSTSLPIMKSIAESTFSDTCDIHVPTIFRDGFGQNKKDFITTSNVECGFNPDPVQRQTREQLTVFDADAMLRLPLTQTFDESYEVTCRGVRYKTAGIKIGNTVKVISLKRITSNG